MQFGFNFFVLNNFCTMKFNSLHFTSFLFFPTSIRKVSVFMVKYHKFWEEINCILVCIVFVLMKIICTYNN